MPNSLQIDLCEITAKIDIPQKPLHENHLANASLTFSGQYGRHITISGFTIWKSNYEGLSVQVPQRNKSFKYWFSDPATLNDITRLILDSYEYEQIPIVKSKDL